MSALITAKLIRLLAQLDRKITTQLNVILHHRAVQQLESAWRNLQFLTIEAAASSRIKIKIFDAGWTELKQDFNKSLEFEQTVLFDQLYNAEFGMPGGEPYGVLVADYAININNYQHTATLSDLTALEQIGQIAATAFVPVILNVAAVSFGVDDIAKLQTSSHLNQLFKQPEFTRWNHFRQTESARFIGLTLPRVLLRTPYPLQATLNTAFLFQEQINTAQDMLWGHASFAFAVTLIHAFIDQGWFTDIQGMGDEHTRGGLVTCLPKSYAQADKAKLQPKFSAELFISDEMERSLVEQGFIPFCQTHHSHVPVFYSARSVQLPQVYTNVRATINAQLSVLLAYLFCACRFAHYIKIIGRNKIGSFTSAAACEQHLTQWLSQYVAGNQTLANPQRAKYPLRDAQVTVKQRPGMPGSFSCIIHLQPRMQTDQIETVFIFVTELQQVANHA